MPVAEAKALRAQIITIDLPGTEGLQIKCCRPDPIALLSNDTLTLPIFANVLEGLNQNNPGAPAATPRTFEELVNRWVCAAALEPRVVFSREEADGRTDAVWVEELTVEQRLAIWGRTNDRCSSPRLTSVLAEFRRQSAGADARSGGTSVSNGAIAVAPGQ